MDNTFKTLSAPSVLPILGFVLKLSLVLTTMFFPRLELLILALILFIFHPAIKPIEYLYEINDQFFIIYTKTKNPEAITVLPIKDIEVCIARQTAIQKIFNAGNIILSLRSNEHPITYTTEYKNIKDYKKIATILDQSITK